MKYVIGQKVKIRNDLNQHNIYSLILLKGMTKKAGEIVTIKEITSDGGYTVKENNYIWSYDMLENIGEEESHQMEQKQENETVEQNGLIDLNNYLFDELKRLNNRNLTQDELDREIKISKQMVSVSQTIINNANLLLNAKKHYDSIKDNNNEIAPLLRLND